MNKFGQPKNKPLTDGKIINKKSNTVFFLFHFICWEFFQGFPVYKIMRANLAIESPDTNNLFSLIWHESQLQSMTFQNKFIVSHFVL